MTLPLLPSSYSREPVALDLMAHELSHGYAGLLADSNQKGFMVCQTHEGAETNFAMELDSDIARAASTMAGPLATLVLEGQLAALDNVQKNMSALDRWLTKARFDPDQNADGPRIVEESSSLTPKQTLEAAKLASRGAALGLIAYHLNPLALVKMANALLNTHEDCGVALNRDAAMMLTFPLAPADSHEVISFVPWLLREQGLISKAQAEAHAHENLGALNALRGKQ